MKRIYKINAEELPEKIEAENLEEAEKIVLNNIAIMEDEKCSCIDCGSDGGMPEDDSMLKH